jgi:predicted peroxiredoxin
MEEKKELVVIISRGFDDERASVAWSISNGGINSGLDVTVFLVSSGVDWVRKGAADKAHLNPIDPSMGDMINSFRKNGGKIIVCPPCIDVRGYDPDDIIDDVEVAGSVAVHERIKRGAAALSF